MNARVADLQRKLEIKRQLERMAARTGFLPFVQYTKPDYQVNWHHRVLARRLQRWVFDPTYRFLMVFMPPRTGKTEMVSKRLPAFIHGVKPRAKIMAATYNITLATEMAEGTQAIMDSARYRELFPNTIITPDGSKTILTRNSIEHEVGTYLDGRLSRMNAEGLLLGDYRAQGVGGSFSGFGADYIMIDDPIKNRQDAESPAFRKELREWYPSTLRNRLEGATGKILITLTRWHEDDLAGFILETMKANAAYDRWDVLSFPALREDMSNPEDPRQLEESLWPEKFPLAEYLALKAGSERDWAALYQQRPAAQEGNIIKAKWMEGRFYTERPAEADLDEVAIFCDLTYKPGEDSDYAVIEAWGRKGTNIYLLDQIRARMGFADQIAAIKEMRKRWPSAIAVEVEEAANGAAVIQTLQGELMGIIPIKPRTSKEARVHTVTPLWQAKNVWLPDSKFWPWSAVNTQEYLTFPSAKFDDCVDTMTMALTRLGRLSNNLERLAALGRL